MNEITEWFKTKDYDAGVQLYASSPGNKSRILSTLQQGHSFRNMGLLISELRKLKQAAPVKPVKIPTRIKLELTPAPTPQVQEEAVRRDLIHKSSDSYFQRVRFGDLPAALRPRFRKLKDLFYDMQDLKFTLNDLPAKAEKDALKIQLAIEALDEEKEGIWKEIDHWQKYKTILPTETGEDFSKLTPQQLYLKKANLANYVHKKNQRIEKWKEALEKERDKQEALKIEQQINRTLQDVHLHELDLKTIEGIL